MGRQKCVVQCRVKIIEELSVVKSRLLGREKCVGILRTEKW